MTTKAKRSKKAEPLRVYTLADVEAWLKRQNPKALFHYSNDGCGCLFTQFVRDQSGRFELFVSVGGLVRNESRNFFGLKVPFHDAFWDAFHLDNYPFFGIVSVKRALAQVRRMMAEEALL